MKKTIKASIKINEDNSVNLSLICRECGSTIEINNESLVCESDCQHDSTPISEIINIFDKSRITENNI